MATERFALKVPGSKSASPDVTVVAPYDRKPIATVATADTHTVEHALAAAHKLYRDRDAWLPLARRIEILEKTASLLCARGEYLAVEAAREGGKPLIDSRVEVARAIDSVRIAVEHLRTQHGEVIPMNVGKPAPAGCGTSPR